MKNRPATPEDIHRIARQSPHVNAILMEWRRGRVSWEDAMMWAVVLLAEENEKLLSTVTMSMLKSPGNPIIMHPRPHHNPDGSVNMLHLPECVCGQDRRGPAGGVCGNCGGAIP